MERISFLFLIGSDDLIEFIVFGSQLIPQSNELATSKASRVLNHFVPYILPACRSNVSATFITTGPKVRMYADSSASLPRSRNVPMPETIAIIRRRAMANSIEERKEIDRLNIYYLLSSAFKASTAFFAISDFAPIGSTFKYFSKYSMALLLSPDSCIASTAISKSAPG